MISRYPLLMNMRGKKVLFVGGGAVAERKISSLITADPTITVLSPEVTDQIKNLSTLGVIKWTTDFPEENFDYVFIATNEREVNQEVYDFFKGKALINIADAPDDCDFHMPAVVVKDGVVVSISTDGESPARSKEIREKLEKWIAEGGLD